ncbi:hypothetical protein M9434_001209 [Picochlorum sp. BPE23]|nr:hypothetical protein M9434_001209 [Picochlorum sp. BPE23]
MAYMASISVSVSRRPQIGPQTVSLSSSNRALGTKALISMRKTSTVAVAKAERTGVVSRASQDDVAELKKVPEPQTRSCVDEEEGSKDFKRMVSAGLLAALIMAGTALAHPEEAYAARSGGRVGGSSFSRRSAPPPRAAPRGGSVRNYNYYSAPPLVSPYGFGMPFFGGGMYAPFPLFGLGSIFNIIILMFMVNVVFNVVTAFTNSKGGKGRDDSWDDDDRW